MADPASTPRHRGSRRAVWQSRRALAAAVGPRTRRTKLKDLVGDPDRDDLPRLAADVKAAPPTSLRQTRVLGRCRQRLPRRGDHCTASKSTRLSRTRRPSLWKWSRDNGAVVFPVREMGKSQGGYRAHESADLGADARFKLCEGHGSSSRTTRRWQPVRRERAGALPIATWIASAVGSR